MNIGPIIKILDVEAEPELPAQKPQPVPEQQPEAVPV